MREIEVQGMTFEEKYSREELQEVVKNVAERINHDYEGREPLFICVLNGAFMFAADLFREITLHSTITFVRLKSYTGMSTTGEVREMIGLPEDLKDRDVIVVEDIVDTGHSMHHFLGRLKEAGVRSAEVCTLLFKPDSLQCEDARPKYVGLEIPKAFIVGYGLDLDEYERNHDAIYALKK